jgi:hypothetical protein
VKTLYISKKDVFALNDERRGAVVLSGRTRFNFLCANLCRKLNGSDSVGTLLRISMSRTFNDLRNYLTSKVNASLQIDDHPALSITIDAVNLTLDYAPAIHTHGKGFNTIEHLLHHYNKYNTGRKLDVSKYLKDGCKRLLQYIVFQEGSYNQLSIAQLLELSPEEWAEMPALESEETATAAPVSEPVSNTITHTHTDAKAAKKERLAELNRRCDAIDRSIREMRRAREEDHASLSKSVTNLENTANRVVLALGNLEGAMLMLTKAMMHRVLGPTHSK